jgi:hypothetical protein
MLAVAAPSVKSTRRCVRSKGTELVAFASERRLMGLAFVTCIAILGTGCRPAGEPLLPVSGRITLDGRPLPRGSVTLRSEPTGATWHQPTGTIDKPGEYVVYTNGRPGAPAGSYRVTVFATETTTAADGTAHPGLPKSLIPLRYNQPEQSPLRLTVATKPPPNGYDLELKSDQSP